VSSLEISEALRDRIAAVLRQVEFCDDWDGDAVCPLCRAGASSFNWEERTGDKHDPKCELSLCLRELYRI